VRAIDIPVVLPDGAKVMMTIRQGDDIDDLVRSFCARHDLAEDCMPHIHTYLLQRYSAAAAAEPASALRREASPLTPEPAVRQDHDGTERSAAAARTRPAELQPTPSPHHQRGRHASAAGARDRFPAAGTDAGVTVEQQPRGSTSTSNGGHGHE